MTKLVHKVQEMREIVRNWHKNGEFVGLIPTMGALHAGHISLVEAIRTKATRTIVTIFVNPTQFAPSEDLSKYPRTLKADVEKLTAIKADLVFAPDVSEMYREGFSSEIHLGRVAKAGLEDVIRPTHFTGVATVVMKLLNQAGADYAIFGEKDFQQLAVIRAMCRDLDHPTQILAGITHRESDGLAMSSRNIYLTPQERAIAPQIYKTMQAIVSGQMTHEEGKKHLTNQGFLVEYLETRRADNLLPVESYKGEKRILFAGRIGKTRLIDNLDFTNKF